MSPAVASASGPALESVPPVPVVEEIPASEATLSSATSIPTSTSPTIPSPAPAPTSTATATSNPTSTPMPASTTPASTPAPAKKSTGFVELYNGAKKLFNAQKYDEALVQFNKAIEASPANNSQMKTLIYSRASCLKKLV